jgi:hypothetical protein
MKFSETASTASLLAVFLALFFSLICSASAYPDPTYQPETYLDDSKLGSLFKSYVELPPLGKFVTGIFVGFIMTRIVMRSALRVLKLVLAVFIV